MTDSEKIDATYKMVKQTRVAQIIVAAITILGFLGIVSILDLKKAVK